MTRRLLVVGASSGIGRAVVNAARAAGWSVAGAARRRDRVADTGALALACDVRVAADCRRVVDDAVEALGSLDALVYAAGVAALGAAADTTPAAWDDMLRTNVVGPALVVGAALPHLASQAGTAMVLSSHSVARPWPGLVPYAASKSAVETLMAGWATECPRVRFRTVPVGPTATGFADSWPAEAAGAYFTEWERSGYLAGPVATAEEAAAEVLAGLG